MKVTALKRKFIFSKNNEDIELQDISGASIDLIANHYSALYPELINSKFEFYKIEDDYEVFKIKTVLGTKG